MDANSTSDTLIYKDPARTEFTYKPGLKEKKELMSGNYFKNKMQEMQDYATGKKKGGGDISMELTGYYEGQVVFNGETGKWETVVHNGGFSAGGGFGYTWKFNSMVGPVPVTAELGLGAAIAVDFGVKTFYEEQVENGQTLKWQNPDKKSVNDYLTTLRIYAYLNAFGGLGFDFSVVALKIGVFGQISLDSRNTWLNRNYLEDEKLRVMDGQSLTFSGMVGIKFYAKFLFISYETVLASASYTKTWLFNEWDEIYAYWDARTGGPVTADNLNEAVEAYIAANPQFRVFSSKAVPAGASDSPKSVATTPQTIEGVFDDAATGQFRRNLKGGDHYSLFNPVISEDGYNALMMRCDSLRSFRARYDTYLDSSGATLPSEVEGLKGKSIDPDTSGKNDFYVSVWTMVPEDMEAKEDGTFSESEQDLMASSTEIVAGIYTTPEGKYYATDTYFRLTDNTTPDMSPVVASDPDRKTAIVAWRNTSMHPNPHTAGLGQNDQILYRIYKDGEWGETQVLYNGTTGGVKGLDITMLWDGSGRAAVTYTLDGPNTGNAENYEVVYAVVDTATGEVIKNQQLTQDSEADENPQVTAAIMNEETGEEQFILAWYHTAGDNADGDIRLAVLDRDGNIRPDTADSLRELMGSQPNRPTSNFQFVRTVNRSIDHVAIAWESREIRQADAVPEGSMPVAGSGLYAVRLTDKGSGRFGASGVSSIIVLADSNQIDSFFVVEPIDYLYHIFDDYETDNDPDIHNGENRSDMRLRAAFAVAQYTGLEEVEAGGETIYTPALAYIPGSATAYMSNEVTVESLDADFDNMIKGLELPVTFTLRNNGAQAVTGLSIELGGKTVTYGPEDIRIEPNGTLDVTVDYLVPESGVVNPAYTVTATFENGIQSTVENTLYLDLPDVGIHSMEVVGEQDGVRDLMLTLNNESEAALAGSGRRVHVGFYTDRNYTEEILDELVIDCDEDLQAIDDDAYRKKFTVELKKYLTEKGYNEIPEAGIPVYARVWIEELDEKGEYQEIQEYYDTNNVSTAQFENLMGRNSGRQFANQAELTNGETTVATITIQNLSMAPAANGNALVVLLDDAGNVIEQKYIADTAEGLMSFGPEGVVTREVAFSKLGSMVKVENFTASPDEMDSTLYGLSLDGLNLAFDKNTAEYRVVGENLSLTYLTAAASGQGAELTLRDGQGNLLATGVQGLAHTLPLQLTTINGQPVAVAGAENRFTITVQPKDERAKPSTYTVLIDNQLNYTGDVTIVPSAPGVEWINASVPEASVTISAEKLTAFPFKTLAYQQNGGEWQNTEQNKVTIQLEDGEYLLLAKALGEGDLATPAVTVPVKVDRTAPVFDGEIAFEKTDKPLEKDNLFAMFMRLFNSATNKQMKVTVRVDDALSGIASVVAATEDGNSYLLEKQEDGNYSGYITRSYDGTVTVTAKDVAGNQAALTSGRILIDDNAPAPTLSGKVAGQTADSVSISGAVAYPDDKYFDRVEVQYRKQGDTDWKTAETIQDAGEAKEFTVEIGKLKAKTVYEYQILAYNAVGDAPAVETGTAATRFATPGKPTVASFDSRSITLTAVEGAVYRCLLDAETETWSDWQNTPVFTGLDPDQSYTFEMKIAALDGIPESAASSADFTTKPLYQVMFTGNDEGGPEATEIPNTQSVGWQEYAEEPAQPWRVGYTFTGWYTDENCEELYDFETAVEENILLYAGWDENVITPEDYTVTGEKDGDWYNELVTITPTGDYTHIWTGSEWAESYVIQEGKDQPITFKLCKLEDGRMVESTFLHEPLELSVDVTAPTGEISIGENGWKSFINTITFGLFFKEKVDVSISAEDAVSGVQTVEYLKTDSDMTLEELEQAEGWKTGNSLSVLPDDRFVVYARITDNVGWVTYLSTDGVVLDATAPVLDVQYAYDGVETKDPHAAVRIRLASEEDDCTIRYTVNGKAYTSKERDFTLTDLPDGDYLITVEAEDAAGNKANAVSVHIIKDTSAEPEVPSTGEPTAGVIAVVVVLVSTGVVLALLLVKQKKRQDSLQ